MEVVIVLAWMLWKWDALHDELNHDFDMDGDGLGHCFGIDAVKMGCSR